MKQVALSTAKLIAEIKRLKQEKNILLLAHYYQREEIQQVADVIGDSLAWVKKPLEQKRSSHSYNQ